MKYYYKDGGFYIDLGATELAAGSTELHKLSNAANKYWADMSGGEKLYYCGNYNIFVLYDPAGYQFTSFSPKGLDRYFSDNLYCGVIDWLHEMANWQDVDFFEFTARTGKTEMVKEYDRLVNDFSEMTYHEIASDFINHINACHAVRLLSKIEGYGFDRLGDF